MYPALAVLEELCEPIEILWVGGEGGMEASLVERAGFPFRAIPAAGVHGVGLRALPLNFWKLIRGTFAARRVVQAFKPNVIFSTGGYVAMPMAVAGWGVPKVIYVPDIEPGLALKIISRLANRIAVTAKASKAYYQNEKKVVVTGYPTRKSMKMTDRENARKTLGFRTDKSVLLVYGGSRGARSINYALWENLDRLLMKVQVIHITGSLDWPQVEYVRSGLPREFIGDYHPYAYLHEEMPLVFASADLAVCRAGAATIGELPLFGLPAILVPYPHAWRYQKTNADYLTQRGAAVQLLDAELSKALYPMVMEMLEDSERLSAMRKASLHLANPGAARAIAEEIERFKPIEERSHG